MYLSATFFIFLFSCVGEKTTQPVRTRWFVRPGCDLMGVFFISGCSVYLGKEKNKLVIKLADDLQTRRYCKTVAVAWPDVTHTHCTYSIRFKYKSVHRRCGKIRYIPPFPFAVHSSHPPTRMPLTPCQPGLRGTPRLPVVRQTGLSQVAVKGS